MKAATVSEKVRIRKQQEANKLRKEENEKKATITQSVSSSKIKRMAKKQLRQMIKVWMMIGIEFIDAIFTSTSIVDYVVSHVYVEFISLNQTQ